MDILADGIAAGRIRQITNNTYRAFDPWGLNPLMAASPTRLQLDWTIENDEALELSNRLAAKFLADRRERAHGIILVCMNAIIATLAYAQDHRQQVLYSRDNTRGTLIKELVDWLADRRWVDTFIAPQSADGGCTSWMVPTDKFNYHIARTGVVIGLRNGYTFTELRGKAKKKGEDKPIIESNTDKYNGRLGKGVTAYNAFILGTMFTLDEKLLIPFLKRIFSNNSYCLGGRFYSALQSLPKAERARILIDLQSVAEPDFSSHHFRIIYALAGCQLDCDPYIVDDYPRDFIKLISIVLMNANSEREFIANVSKSGKPGVKKMADRWGQRCNYYSEGMRMYREGIIREKPKQPTLSNQILDTKEKKAKEEKLRGVLAGFIKGVPDGMKGKPLFDSIKKKHSPVEHLLCTKDIGLRLQYVDGQITDRIIKETTKRRIPVSPVHDSYICKQSDEEEVKEIMLGAYHKQTGFHAKIG